MQYLQTKQQDMLNYAGAVELAHNPVLILSLVLLNFRFIILATTIFYRSIITASILVIFSDLLVRFLCLSIVQYIIC
jgi:hypothetical protein